MTFRDQCRLCLLRADPPIWRVKSANESAQSALGNG